MYFSWKTEIILIYKILFFLLTEKRFVLERQIPGVKCLQVCITGMEAVLEHG